MPKVSVMVFIIMKTLVLLLFSVMAGAQSPPSLNHSLVIIGDSLTEGYGVSAEEAFPAQLQKIFNKNGNNWKVISEGISGSTSASAPSRVRWTLKKPPQMVILALGANDGLRGIEASATEKNLDQALALLTEAHVKVILAGMKMPPNYQGRNKDQFEKIYPRLAKKYHIQLIPFLLKDVAGISSLNQKDGIHPNAKGHAIIAKNIYKYLQPNL